MLGGVLPSRGLAILWKLQSLWSFLRPFLSSKFSMRRTGQESIPWLTRMASEGKGMRLWAVQYRVQTSKFWLHIRKNFKAIPQ
jgi:hypothetical protein